MTQSHLCRFYRPEVWGLPVKRAGTDDKKRQRRQDILDVAKLLVAARGCDSWRLEEIAAQLSLVKGTLYLYFATRQDLLAALLRQEMETWWDSVQAQAPTPDEPTAFLSAGLAGRPLLIKLLTSLHMGIESGISAAGLLELKLWFADFFQRATVTVERALPGLGGSAGQFLLEYYALVVGAAQLAYPPPTVAELIAHRAELAVFRIDFGDFLAQAVKRLYAGYC